ncbi:MAG TPA: FAD-dependent monooxygenase [Ktedonosporobacter sp.]|nr:FAD-dependent monooxygenase [Ktedonosporobacter sp.]
MSTPTNVDVLVVGAGPVGLTLANELIRHGLNCRIVDSAPHATEKTKALGIMPRTLELLEKMGVAETAIAAGLKTPSFSPFIDGKRATTIDFQEHLLDSPYPFVLMLPQNETEALLTEHLHSQGGAIEWQAELIAVTQDEQGVEAVLRHADGEEEHIQVGWLVGCDGAHSMVRHLLGLNFVGTAFEQSFAVGNVRLTWELPYDEIFAFIHQGSFIAYFPMRNGRHRVVIAYELDKAPTGDVTLEEVQQVIDICGPAGTRASEPADLGRFHVNQRKAEHYAQGHVFLAGDAAHIHSPIGAQGMNTGIQDAFNLSWKLALVAKGQASRQLLASYEAEREQVGKELLRGTEFFTRMVLASNPLLTTVRNHLAPLVLSSLPGVQHQLAQGILEVGISYHKSPIVQEEQTHRSHQRLHAGDRAPDGPVVVNGSPRQIFELLRGTQHVLLGFAGQQSSSGESHKAIDDCIGHYSEVVDNYWITQHPPEQGKEVVANLLHDPDGALQRRYGIADEGYVLIRPDGYIGLYSQTLDVEVLRRYLEEMFLAQR